MNIMFATRENHQKWLYDTSNWNQARTDLNAAEVIDYFEKGDRDFPSEYLYKPCLELADAEYRLEIMREVYESLHGELSAYITDLKKLRALFRDFKEEKHELQKNYRYLLVFCEYAKLAGELEAVLANVRSDGLRKVYHYCGELMSDGAFNSGREFADRLAGEISAVLESTKLVINPHAKTLLPVERGGAGETELLLGEIFEVYGVKMKDSFSIVDPTPLSYLEEQVLVMLSEKEQNRGIFEELEQFADTYAGMLENIKVFAELLPQLVFFVNYIDFINLQKAGGLSACAPEFGEDYTARDCASVSLAVKFYHGRLNVGDIVRNDINLPGGGKFILSGPNQGGKTIYLKQLGLTAYLAKCGCYVLCEFCRAPFYDKIFTHFMHKEILGKSRLVEEIERIENMTPDITRDSLVLLNESFTSTRRKDSVEISLHYLKRFGEVGCSVGFVSLFMNCRSLTGA